MAGDDPKSRAVNGQLIPPRNNAFHDLPRLRSSSPLTSLLVQLGLLDEVNLLEREAKAWNAVERVAQGQLRAARAMEEVRHLPAILAEDNERRKYEFEVAADQREHDRKMAPLLRKIDALKKGAELTEARRATIEAAQRLKAVQHPPPPPTPEPVAEDPNSPAVLTRQFTAALEEIATTEGLSPEQKDALTETLTRAFKIKIGDMTY